MARTKVDMKDDILYGLCARFLGGMKADKVAKWVRDQGVENFSRVQVHQWLRTAIKRDFLVLKPPHDQDLAAKLSKRFPNAGSIDVVSARQTAAVAAVATKAAELIDELIGQLEESGKDTISIGFGAGSTMLQVARHLAVRLRTRAELPKLHFHALSSGFSYVRPETAPVAFFSFFNGIAAPDHFRFVGLFAPAMVNTDDYERTRELPGVREAFKAARDVDIVVTSLARREDPHSRFNKFMKVAPDEQKEELKEAGWVGDVLWQPFSRHEPILVQNGLRAMSTFDLPMLREWAGRKDKHVVLVAGPCGKCGRHKASALRPLLVEPNLRVSNHLVTHLDTAEVLLETKNSQAEMDTEEFFLDEEAIDSLSDADLEEYLKGYGIKTIDE